MFSLPERSGSGAHNLNKKMKNNIQKIFSDYDHELARCQMHFIPSLSLSVSEFNMSDVLMGGGGVLSNKFPKKSKNIQKFHFSYNEKSVESIQLTYRFR